MKNLPILKKPLFLTLASLLILFAGCAKKEIKGPQGDPGTPGAGGNANISTTNTFVIKSADWKADSLTEALKASVNFATLTKDVVDKGTVKVYIQTGSSWFELPYDTGDLLMQYGFQEGVLSLYYINIEGGFPSSPGTATYRMVIISASARPAQTNFGLENEVSVEKADVNNSLELTP